MSDEESDRRRVERVQFAQPVPATVGDLEATVLDVGLLGARIRHDRPLELDQSVPLRFEIEGEMIEVDCLVTRCEFQPILSEARGERVYLSGLSFLAGGGAAAGALRRLISNHVVRALEAQKANAHAAVAELADDVPFVRESTGGGRVRRAQPASYVCCRLGPDGVWKKTIIARPAQPVDGFTVRLGDTEDEVERLCRAYEAASPEVRKLIRLCAEMSGVDEDQPLPPQNFVP
ncbi:MAG: hypothetical protein ACRD2J_05820 [Thermoanaerobaculia bacterium]